MKMKDLRGKRIHWNLTPEIAMSGWDEWTGYYFFIDVRDYIARLAVMYKDEIGGGKSKIIEDAPVSQEEFEDAITEQGGWIHLDGHYAIDEKIRNRLKMTLSFRIKDKKRVKKRSR
jgi:hypothetical protein